LYNEEVKNLYSSQNITKINKSRRVRWAVHVLHMADIRNVYNIFVGKPGRPRHGWGII
jgi:hypothetical protein